jgi:argininosuccinate synthase
MDSRVRDRQRLLSDGLGCDGLGRVVMIEARGVGFKVRGCFPALHSCWCGHNAQR